MEMVANIGGALVADGLQSGVARDTREMLKTVTSQAVGRWAWGASETSVNKALGIQPVGGFDLPEAAAQSVVQGGAAWVACMLAGMPRTFMRSWIDAAAGTLAEAAVAQRGVARAKIAIPGMTS